MPDHELAEVDLDKVITKWQKKNDLKQFEVVDMVLRCGLNLYIKERSQSEVNHVS